jgi:hypothetical protein
MLRPIAAIAVGSSFWTVLSFSELPLALAISLQVTRAARLRTVRQAARVKELEKFLPYLNQLPQNWTGS